MPDKVLRRGTARNNNLKYNLYPAVPNVPIKHHCNGLCHLHLTTHSTHTHELHEKGFSSISKLKSFLVNLVLNLNVFLNQSPSHICDDIEGDPDVDKEVKRNDSELKEKCAKAGCCHCHHPIECECCREGPDRDCEL